MGLLHSPALPTPLSTGGNQALSSHPGSKRGGAALLAAPVLPAPSLPKGTLVDPQTPW